jgi:hypothetical protein
MEACSLDILQLTEEEFIRQSLWDFFLKKWWWGVARAAQIFNYSVKIIDEFTVDTTKVRHEDGKQKVKRNL